MKKPNKKILQQKKAAIKTRAKNPDNWASYKDACKFGRSLNLSSYKEWNEYTRENVLPEGIPKAPHRVYEGIFTTGEFLNSKVNLRKKNRQRLSEVKAETKRSSINENGFLEFVQAKSFVQSLALSSSKTYYEWHEMNGAEHPEIPARPHRTYHLEWKGWPDFLGTDAVSTHFADKDFCTYLDAKKFAHGLKLKNATQWREWCKLNTASRLDVPRMPQKTYSKTWEGWDKFLGTDIVDAIATRQATTPVLYVAQEPETPRNVYTIAIEQHGQGAVYDNIVLRKKGRILSLYEFDNDMVEVHLSRMDLLKRIVAANSSGYLYGRDNQRIVHNIHQLKWDLTDYCDIVPIRIPKQILTQLQRENAPATAKDKAAATANLAMFGNMGDKM